MIEIRPHSHVFRLQFTPSRHGVAVSIVRRTFSGSDVHDRRQDSLWLDAGDCYGQSLPDLLRTVLEHLEDPPLRSTPPRRAAPEPPGGGYGGA